MVSFRKWILALTVIALFVGVAGAQVNTGTNGGGALTCATNVSVTPSLRAEGYTEQTGDITISCTGGGVATPGSQIPQVNIAVFMNSQVTSRLLPITSVSNNTSEALLLIDEPGAANPPTNLTGTGPAQPQILCSTPLTGCIQYVGNTGATLGQAVSGCASQG